MGASLLKSIAPDQAEIWSSPFHLSPWAGRLAGPVSSNGHRHLGSGHPFIPVGHDLLRVESAKATTFRTTESARWEALQAASTFGEKRSHDDHKREAGVLAGEAAIDAVAVTTTLQYVFGRQRPTDGGARGLFWRGGSSFPSDHSAAAWAAASVLAHEYPGPLTKLLVYGLAAAVSASRVTGQDHFPSDVVVGGVIGWLAGQHVYRAHHDPELGGANWESFLESRDSASGRNAGNSGSPYVPLDSWIYPALERLAALGYIHSAFEGTRPWTRLECAALVQEAGEDIAGAESVPEKHFNCMRAWKTNCAEISRPWRETARSDPFKSSRFMRRQPESAASHSTTAIISARRSSTISGAPTSKASTPTTDSPLTPRPGDLPFTCGESSGDRRAARACRPAGRSGSNRFRG